ncbi:MAG: tRNA (N(6)-L-threonylcarbamoyladenosine(37)-C(2))-methylthiotransferase MtaB [Flavobacteriales bacterium CG_4_9_14_0_2_um_filter_35_242]|nr:tRNA (N(6)-L-threonylcarbamoyladenosine(37)-C(2))-methylthiotransferase MtaB [Zetaproteobacteria bacterium]NDK17465.1 tRNA (N(6)-L-threonylcarbamoyladenosine(37)-C(2))-methylthiotransferase MtaB [Flavobacteriales bacterium]OIO11315.1 MAG: tRNA (N(6)-L-threonylcarbamoyladenosine(37)-C(2))-methylthiotransferase MtaB [Flavobacteriaceae bacterium CG1_02_35_72]PJC58046.1 MAG: tRNA (N(6)-L-threonylcarbamoyladenosine(37)-C(2))-methylthiotransferase MtaB [Flavobacteriales bacterium CG_4_9_14_0_2_um_f
MPAQKKVAFYTLGCKLNFSETSTIARQFSGEGFARVPFEKPADIYVINTCSVTENADKRFKTIVKNCLKINDKAFVIAIGCYAQLKPETLAQVDGVDLVLGATEKFKITNYLNDLTKNDMGTIHSCEIEEADCYESAYSFGDRTRAFLKVQDGCDYKCTYCTIPLARGISRSDSLENVIANAKLIANKGLKEIVLTGVNIGDYGKGEFGDKKHAHTFLDLVKALDAVEGINRLRISSIEPNLLTNETIDFVAQSKRFVPHFHIPLQSGSNELLKLMKRRYLKEVYVNRVEQIKKLMPNACIGVDVIVGFPGETDELFLETYHFLNELNISYLHVFTYSERPNTEANLMKGIVPMEIRHKRSKLLRGLSVKKRRAFYESQLETTLNVLFESANKDGFMYGFTENYVKVKTPFNADLINTVHLVKLTKIDLDGKVLFDWTTAQSSIEKIKILSL